MLSLPYRCALVCLLATVWSSSAYAQEVPKQPEYTLSIITPDYAPVDMDKGVPRDIGYLTVKGQLTASSCQEYPQLEPYVLIKQTITSIIRNGRRRAMINWVGEKIPLYSLNSPEDPLQAGDRCVMEFVDVRTKAKNGVTRKFAGKKRFMFTFY